MMLHPTERTAPIRSILHAAAQVLRCDSVNMARVTEDRQELVLSIAENAWGQTQLHAVETTLGVPLTGIRIPLSWTESLLVRVFREQRVFFTEDVIELAGNALPAEIIQSIRQIIGVRLFGLVPITGRGGPLGVLLAERLGSTPFTDAERDLLLLYADRVGAELESSALDDEASRLEQLGQVPAAPPPTLWLCTAGDPNGPLVCRGGAADGHPLHAVLGLSDSTLLFNQEIFRRLHTGEVVTVQFSVSSPGLPQPLASRMLRATLRLHPNTQEFLCAVEDLGWSERLRREALLAREHLSKVMQALGDAILTLDTEGIIRRANDACSTVLGVPPEKLVGRTALELAITGKGRDRLVTLQSRLRKSGFAEQKLRLKRDRGENRGFPAQLSAMLLCDESLQAVGEVWRIHDLTERRRDAAERRRLRLRLLQTERLSAVGEMAARIAHEVRNPLVSIGAAAQLVTEELAEDSPLQPELRAIRGEVRRLDGIITEFLRFARPRRQKITPTDVKQATREVIEMIRPKASGLSIKLSCGEPSEPARALIDPDGLKQVLWNVLLNACEVSRPGDGPASTIECVIRRRQVAESASSITPTPASSRTPSRALRGRVVITVADSGPGIPPAVRRRVFDPFFSTKSRGTGLGLSICKQIIEEHGGRIRLLNRREGGTRVVIELRPEGVDGRT